MLLLHFDLSLDSEPQGSFLAGLDSALSPQQITHWSNAIAEDIPVPSDDLAFRQDQPFHFWLTRTGLERVWRHLRDLVDKINADSIMDVAVYTLQTAKDELKDAIVYEDETQIVLRDSAIRPDRVSKPVILSEPGDFTAVLKPIAEGVEPELCPICGRFYTEPPAISRHRGTNGICPAICPECGTREAMENSGADENDIDSAIEAVRTAKRTLARCASRRPT